jgi:SAM-dependent methyltransferase
MYGGRMASLVQHLLARANRAHSVRSYNALVARFRRQYRGDYDMAMIASIGALSPLEFERQGDGHVAVLRHYGLRDGMSVYDLGCGSGRTAMALQRSGWQGQYKGADIVKPLVRYLKSKCPDYDAVVHRKLTIAAPDASLDMVFHWSVFTHLYPEECFLYMEDTFRALKPGGCLVFSFLELEDVKHHAVFESRLGRFRKFGWSDTLDVFLHRDWIRFWAQSIGFEDISFTDGTDGTNHPQFWQALASMKKPA